MRSLYIECDPDSAAAKQKDKLQAAITKVFATGGVIVVGGIVIVVCVIIFVWKLLSPVQATHRKESKVTCPISFLLHKKKGIPCGYICMIKEWLL